MGLREANRQLPKREGMRTARSPRRGEQATEAYALSFGHTDGRPLAALLSERHSASGPARSRASCRTHWGTTATLRPRTVRLRAETGSVGVTRFAAIVLASLLWANRSEPRMPSSRPARGRRCACTHSPVTGYRSPVTGHRSPATGPVSRRRARRGDRARLGRRAAAQNSSTSPRVSAHCSGEGGEPASGRVVSSGPCPGSGRSPAAGPVRRPRA